MACLNVESVNEKIACIQNMENEAMEKEIELIARDLKAYIFDNFSVDKFQQRILDRIGADTFKEYGKTIARAFSERNVIEAKQGAKLKCPEITITITIKF